MVDSHYREIRDMREDALKDQVADLQDLLDEERAKTSDFIRGLDWVIPQVLTGKIHLAQMPYVLTVPFLVEAGKRNVGVLLPRAEILKEVSDKLVEAVEDELSMGAGAWDMVDPKESIRAVLKVCLLRENLS